MSKFVAQWTMPASRKYHLKTLTAKLPAQVSMQMCGLEINRKQQHKKECQQRINNWQSSTITTRTKLPLTWAFLLLGIKVSQMVNKTKLKFLSSLSCPRNQSGDLWDPLWHVHVRQGWQGHQDHFGGSAWSHWWDYGTSHRILDPQWSWDHLLCRKVFLHSVV